MTAYIIVGFTFAFAAGVQPGPLQTYLISETLNRGFRRTLPAVLSPVISDGPIALLMLLVLTTMPPGFVSALRIAGGVFIVYLAGMAFQAYRRFQATPTDQSPASRRSLPKAVLVNLLNPNPYLGWSLVLGPQFLQGWRETPANGIALVIAFYLTMVATLVGIVALFAMAKNLGPRVSRALIGLSAIALLFFGGYQLWVGIGSIIQ